MAKVTLLALANGMPGLMTAMSAISEANDFHMVMGDAFSASTFVLTVVPGAGLLCSSVAISVEPKTILLISLSIIVVSDLIFVVSYDHAFILMESIGLCVFYVIYAGLVIFMGRQLGAS